MRRAITCAAMLAMALVAMPGQAPAAERPLWDVYANVLKGAKYIDLTHAFEPVQTVWPGFGNATF